MMYGRINSLDFIITFLSVLWEYADDDRSRRQSYTNVRGTLTNRCDYPHVKTNSDTMFVNFLRNPDVGRDTFVHFGSKNGILEKMFKTNALGPCKCFYQ